MPASLTAIISYWPISDKRNWLYYSRGVNLEGELSLTHLYEI